MTIFDAEHFTGEERAAELANHPPHERDARTKGVPQLGSGRVFAAAEEVVRIAAFPVPAHWPQIAGIDFGWDHPTAAVRLAWDRDGDALYVTHAYRRKGATPVIHAAALRPWGADAGGRQWLPWAWPKDGYQHEKGSGRTLAQAYRGEGLRMLEGHARFDDDAAAGRGDSVEAGVLEMVERMETGRLRVFAHLDEWFDEYRLYHRADGRIVKAQDDLLDATRYALMMRRFASVPARARAHRRAGTAFDVFAD